MVMDSHRLQNVKVTIFSATKHSIKICSSIILSEKPHSSLPLQTTTPTPSLKMHVFLGKHGNK